MKKTILILPVLALQSPMVFLAAEEEKTVHVSFIYSEFFIQILATIFLLWIIKKFAWEKFQKALEQRQTNINKNIDDAEVAKINAKSLESEKQQELNNISLKKNDILKTAMDRAKEKEHEVVSEAKRRSKNLLEKAQEEAQKEKDSVKEDLSKELAGVSLEFVKKFMFEEITEEQEQRLIKQATAKVSNE